MDTSIELMETLTPGRIAWLRAIEDPSLRELPYRIESNEYGQLVMSPVRNRHSLHAGRIADLLLELIERRGALALEFGIDTQKGVKVPDIAWISTERRALLDPDDDASAVAPEICIEVLSPGNTPDEIESKRSLYFASGAVECWTCDENGRMRFFDRDVELSASRLVPRFPHRIEI